MLFLPAMIADCSQGFLQKNTLFGEKRKVEIFFRPAREALAGGKKAFKAARKRTPFSRPHTHNCNGNMV